MKLLFLWLGGACVAFTFFAFAVCIGRNIEREQAIKCGVAFYSVDSITGEKSFNYGVRQ